MLILVEISGTQAQGYALFVPLCLYYQFFLATYFAFLFRVILLALAVSVWPQQRKKYVRYHMHGKNNAC